MSAEPNVITSLHNPAIKRARSLLRRKGRHEERAFLVEGMTAVADAISTGAIPEVIFVRDGDERAIMGRSSRETRPESGSVTADVLASPD